MTVTSPDVQEGVRPERSAAGVSRAEASEGEADMMKRTGPSRNRRVEETYNSTCGVRYNPGPVSKVYVRIHHRGLLYLHQNAWATDLPLIEPCG